MHMRADTSLSLFPSLRALLAPLGCLRPCTGEETTATGPLLANVACPSVAVLLQKAELLLSMMNGRSPSLMPSGPALSPSPTADRSVGLGTAFVHLDRTPVDDEYEDAMGLGEVCCTSLPHREPKGSASCSPLGFFDVEPVKHVACAAINGPSGDPAHSTKCHVQFPLTWELSELVHCEAVYNAMSSYGGVAMVDCRTGATTLLLAPGANPSEVPLMDQHGAAQTTRAGVGPCGLESVANRLSDAS